MTDQLGNSTTKKNTDEVVEKKEKKHMKRVVFIQGRTIEELESKVEKLPKEYVFAASHTSGSRYVLIMQLKGSK